MKIKNLVNIFISLFGSVLCCFIFLFIVKEYPSINVEKIFKAGISELSLISILITVIIVMIISLPTYYIKRKEKDIKELMQDLRAEQNLEDYPIQIIFFVILGGILSASIWTLFTYSIGMIMLDSSQLGLIIILLVIVILIICGYYVWLRKKTSSKVSLLF